MDVMASFYGVRVEYYGKRRVHLLNTLTDAWEKLDNKVSFALLKCTLVVLTLYFDLVVCRR